MRKLVGEFRAFALRGNVFELAIAFILGLAFNAVVQSLVNDVIMNLVAALFGRPDFSELVFRVGDGVVRYGVFLNTVVNFVLVAFALFAVAKALNRAREARGEKTDAPNSKECPYCLTSISLKAQRCPACTSQLQVA
jgi:large conductance mechanosensitive channel